MFDEYITFTQINDFLYSPASLYMHGAFKDMSASFFKAKAQTAGSIAHETLEEERYTTSKDVLQAKMLYCEKYKIAGKIDYFNTKTGELVERKNKISYLHKGYMYQIWGQYFALREAGHRVRTLSIHSKTDNKKYNVPLPTQKDEKDFASLLQKMRNFDPKTLLQTHTDKNGKESIYGSLAW